MQTARLTSSNFQIPAHLLPSVNRPCLPQAGISFPQDPGETVTLTATSGNDSGKERFGKNEAGQRTSAAPETESLKHRSPVNNPAPASGVIQNANGTLTIMDPDVQEAPFMAARPLSGMDTEVDLESMRASSKTSAQLRDESLRRESIEHTHDHTATCGRGTNGAAMPQRTSTLFYGATEEEADFISDVLDHPCNLPYGAWDNLPRPQTVHMIENDVFQSADGSLSRIRGLSTARSNELFFNRTMLHGREHEVIFSGNINQYRQALETAKAEDLEGWKGTILHEIGHNHDWALGSGGAYRSEMADSPFGRGEWCSEYAKSSKSKVEDCAEAYRNLAELRSNMLNAGCAEEHFIRAAVTNPDYHQKYRFILEKYWSYDPVELNAAMGQ